MIAYTDYRFDARVRREAETLVGAGFQVVCITPRVPETPNRFVLDGVQIRTVPVGKYQGDRTSRYIGSYLKFLCLSGMVCSRLSLTKEVKAFHVHNLPDFLVFAALLPRLIGKKVVLDIHDSVPETFVTKFPDAGPFVVKCLRWEERVSTLLAHRVICVNHPQQAALVQRGLRPGKSFVSMNVPDSRLFPARSPTVRSGSDPAFRLVYHGTMARRLGVDLIIQAAARLKSRIPGVEVHLWGPGDDVSHFQALAGQLSMNGVVRFEPQGFHLHELASRLTAMHVGVVGNRRNAATDLMLPVKLLEYVALGIPVVAPRLPAIENYFDDGMLTYFEPENVDSMADSIFSLYADPKAARKRASRAQEFLRTYGWERQGPALVDFYTELIGGTN